MHAKRVTKRSVLWKQMLEKDMKVRKEGEVLPTGNPQGNQHSLRQVPPLGE